MNGFLILSAFFSFLFFALPDIEFKFFTLEDVIKRFTKLAKTNQKFLEVPDNPGVIGNDSMESEVNNGEEDKKQYQHDDFSRECRLRSKRQSPLYRQRLSELGKYHIPTPGNDMCLYEALLLSLFPYLKDKSLMDHYTAYHFKYQLMMWVLDCFEQGGFTLLKEKVMPNVIFLLIVTKCSLFAWFKKMSHLDDWGDAYNIFPIVKTMWKLNLRCNQIDENTFRMTNYKVLIDPEESDEYERPMIDILYNSDNHFTAAIPCGTTGVYSFPLLVFFVAA